MYKNQFSKFTAIEKQPETFLMEHPIIVDSRDRDRNIYPNTNNFSVKFGDNSLGNIPCDLNDIACIELNQVIMPQTINSGTTGVSYINLVIPELDNILHGTNTKLNCGFAILSPQDVYGNSFLSSKLYRPVKRHFRPPKSSLHKLTFQFYDPDGNLFDFGADTESNNPIENDVQVMLYFTIYTKEPIQQPTYFR